MIDFRTLVKAGVHFGHQSSRWNPRMAPYIWGIKDNVHLINVAKTAAQLEKACKELEKIVAEGKTVLWIGTKKTAQQTITNAAQGVNMPFVTHRWIGGTLTNFPQVKKSVTRYLHFQDVVTKADTAQHTKKELNSYQKVVGRLHKNIGGIVNLSWPIGAIVVVDVKKEASAVKEAASVGIPVFAIVDTNCDPLLVNFVIPGNDDSAHSIEALIKPLAEAAVRGKAVADEKRKEEEKENELFREKRRAARREAELNPSESNEALVALLEKEEEEESEEGKKSGKKTFAPRREGSSQRPTGHNNRAAGQKRTFDKSNFSTSAPAGQDAPRKPFDPSAPRREWTPRAEGQEGQRRPYDPNAPRKPFDPNAPRREWTPRAEGQEGQRRPYDPNAPRPPRRPYDPNAPRKPYDPNAPRREWTPRAEGQEGQRRPYDPNAPRPPRRPYDPNAPRKPYDPNAPRREWTPRAEGQEGQRRPYDPNAPRPPRRPYDPNAPRRPYDPNAPRPPRREWTPRTDASATKPANNSATENKQEAAPQTTPDTTKE